jgi:acetyl esterase/lipase
MQRLKIFGLTALAAFLASAATVEIPLWPEGSIPERDASQTIPSLNVVLPADRTNDTLLIVSPGGSYMKWCGYEGKCAGYFNSKGLATALLRYRTPRPVGRQKHVSAWQDAQRAVRICRANAKAWKVNPERIFFIGFSAGGNLTILAAASSQTPAYARVDAIDDLPCHVNGAIACYPAYILSDCKGYGSNPCLYDGGNRQKGNPLDLEIDPIFKFDAKTPPMCFLHGDADSHSPMGSVRVYHKLRTMGIPAEIHVFSGRKHADLPRGTWHDLVWTWIERNTK